MRRSMLAQKQVLNSIDTGLKELGRCKGQGCLLKILRDWKEELKILREGLKIVRQSLETVCLVSLKDPQV